MDGFVALLTHLLAVTTIHCLHNPAIDILSIVEEMSCAGLHAKMSETQRNILLCARRCGMVPWCVATEYKRTSRLCQMFEELCPNLISSAESFYSNISSWPEQIQLPCGHESCFQGSETCIPGPNGGGACISPKAMKNLALGKPASQDMTYYDLVAANGVDGNFSTSTLSDMTWQVDLEIPTVVRRIVLKALSTHVDNTLCVKIDGVLCDACVNVVANVATTTTFVCESERGGQIISVEKQVAWSYLEVFELEAFSF